MMSAASTEPGMEQKEKKRELEAEEQVVTLRVGSKDLRMHSKWLRSQCGPVHEATNQRLFDIADCDGLLSEPPTLSADGKSFSVAFADGSSGTFDVARVCHELEVGACGGKYALPQRVPWGCDEAAVNGTAVTIHDIRRFDWAAASKTEQGGRHMIGELCTQMLTHGVAVVRGVPPEEGQVTEWMSRIGTVRRTEWGNHFDVRTVQAREGEGVLTADLAYTNAAIDLHHDNPYRDPTPGFWCLHCIQSSNAQGSGMSMTSDGLNAALMLKREDPEAYDVLTRVKVYYKYESDAGDVALVTSMPHIVEGQHAAASDGWGIKQVIYSGRLDEVPAAEYSPEVLSAYYRARTKWYNIARSQAIYFKAEAGDLIIVDNQRCMHARSAIDPAIDTKPRFLQGCYIDRDGVTSKYFRHQMRQQAAAGLPALAAASVGLEQGSKKRKLEAPPSPDTPPDSPPHSMPRVVSFKSLSEGTQEDFALMTTQYQEGCTAEMLANRVIKMLTDLDGEDTKFGARVSLYEHSLQTATRAHRAGAEEEAVVAALLHDIGELLSPASHGEIPAAILGPYLSPKWTWVLNHHEIFQGYHYFHHVGGDRNRREEFAGHEHYAACVQFCDEWDQASFDDTYTSYSLDFFRPMVANIFRREPYWWSPDHPKKVAVVAGGPK